MTKHTSYTLPIEQFISAENFFVAIEKKNLKFVFFKCSENMFSWFLVEMKKNSLLRDCEIKLKFPINFFRAH